MQLTDSNGNIYGVGGLEITGIDGKPKVPVIPATLIVNSTPITGGTAGRILFEGTGNVLQESSNLFWDQVNNRLGIGTNAPATTLQVGGTITSQAIIPVADSTHNLGTSALRYNVVFGRTLSANTSSLDLIGFNVRLNDFSGVTRAMLNSNNNFLIGTTTDAGYRLDVNGTARVQGNAQFGTGFYWDNTNNRLGIGTASPTAILHLVGQDSSVSVFTQSYYVNTQGNAPGFTLQRARGTIASPSSLLSDDVIAGFFASGYHSGGAFGANTTAFRFVASQNFTSTAQGTRIEFFTTPNGSTTRAERLRITDAGNLLIGTTTDAGFRLDVNGTARVSGAATITAQTKIGTTVYTDASSSLLIGKISGSTAARGFLASDTNYQDFGFVATAVSAGNINSWGFGQRRDTYFGNQIGSFQIVGAYYNNSGVGSMVGGGFRVPLICNPDGTVIIAGASSNAINGNVLVGTTTDIASSKLTIESTTQGFLPPRMTSTERDAIASPAVGLQIFNTTTSCVEYYDTFWGWMPVSPTNEWYSSYGFNYFNDGVQGDNVMGVGASGAGAGINGGANILGANGPGNATFITGTLATGTCRIASHSNYVIGGGRILQEYRCGHAILSTASERYTSVLGFQDVFGSPNQVDGVFFLYDEGGVASGSTASPNWQCVTSSNSVRTFTTTSISVASQRKLRFTINDAGTQVLFYIDNVLVATHTTNIPTGNSRSANWGAMVTKSVGTTSTQALLLDYISFKTKFTTPR
jgi:hypothetical protein